MNNKKHIFLSSPHMSKEGYEQIFIKEAFETNWIAPLGNNVDKFEEELAMQIGTNSAAALSSGTAAIHMALKAIGIQKGDVVLCPTLTFSATVNPVLYENATPVFIDSNMETWNISPEALEIGLKKYAKHVKAVIIVHLYGLCADLDAIMDLCNRYEVPIIEDAAESLGSIYHSQWTGTYGNYGIFSFNGNKIITTSGGGMVVCNLDTELADERIRKIRFWSTQSRDKARHYQHSEIGYNYRMSNVVAGIGRGQLKVLKERVEKKRYIYDFYKKAFSDISCIQMMPMLENTYSNCWLSCFQLDNKKTNVTPEQIMDALEKDNIESRPIWKPMHLQPVFMQYDYIDHNNCAERLFDNGICLPSDTKMTDEDLNRVTSIIKNILV